MAHGVLVLQCECRQYFQVLHLQMTLLTSFDNSAPGVFLAALCLVLLHFFHVRCKPGVNLRTDGRGGAGVKRDTKC